MLAFFRTLLAVIIGFFLAIFLIVIIVSSLAGGDGEKHDVKNKTILTINLSRDMPERPLQNPLEDVPFAPKDFSMPISLKEILDEIRHAKEDSKIKGILLEGNLLSPGLPTLEEIRNALIDFKKSGKFIYAYNELFTQKNYYLSSVADSIFINPNGAFSFAGFHSEQIFFKGLLNKLEIEPHLIRAGKYKSAGETFINDSMSEANRMQLMEYINSAYEDYLAKISKARNITPQELRRIADNLLIRYPEDAVKYKLADKLAYKDQVLASMSRRVEVKKTSDLELVSIDDYRKGKHPHKVSPRGNIAVIYAVGDINSGEGSETEIGSESVSKAIREAREDEDVKAIVLRVNSPGGSALASDVIWREVVLAKQKKPVIASFGDLAASGGYYIAAPADMIFSQSNTITGSIGVFGLLPGLKKFWKNKLGITWDRVKTGKYADLGNVNRDMTADELNIIQNYVDTTYEQFKRRVASGRKMTIERVQELAQGRIYSGTQAKQNGLVDAIGSLDDAIAEAAKRANLKDYKLRILPEYEPNFFRALSHLDGAQQQLFIQENLMKNYKLFQDLQNVQNLQGILMYMPYEIVVE